MKNGLPKVKKLYIEVTNFCNFHCDFCPLTYSGRERTHLEYPLYTKIIDEVSTIGITDTVGFHIVGEPMMYPNIFQAIQYARDCGLQTEMTTNGSLLTDEKIQRLGDIGLNRLTISLQRFGDTDHSGRGAPFSFDRYYARILESIHSLAISDFPMEVLILYMNASTKRFFDIDQRMRMNWDSESYRHGLARILCDVYRAVEIQVRMDVLTPIVRKLRLYRGYEFQIGKNIRVVIRPFFDWGNAFIDNEKLVLSRFGYCNLAFSSLGILSNGQLVICCGDFDGETALGHIRDNSIEELLIGKEAISIINGFRKCKLVHPRCQKCLASTSSFKTFVKSLFAVGMYKIIKPGPGFAIKQTDLLAEMAN